jgi:hypothetical protein
MGKYGDTAVRAVELLRASRVSAEEAWREAAAEQFPSAPEARAKTCPREPFLGLVQHGLIRGIAPGRCTRNDARLNRAYSTAAATMVADDPGLASTSKSELWRRVMAHVGYEPDKKHNQQLDVVLTLHARRLLSYQ